MMAREGIDTYLEALHHAIQGVECTDVNRRPIDLGDAFGHVSREAHLAHRRGNKLMFVGNGGSAGIASHLAIVFS